MMSTETSQNSPLTQSHAGIGTHAPVGMPAPEVSAGSASAARHELQGAAEQAQDQAQHAVDQLQERLREQIDQRSAQAVEQITAQASDLRSVSDALRSEGKPGPADAAERLAEYAEKVGRYLSDKDSDALLADAEEFGRQRPWAAAAGGLAIGLAASRFLKASSGRRYRSRNSSPNSHRIDGAGLTRPGDGMRSTGGGDPVDFSYPHQPGYAGIPAAGDQSGSGSAG